MIIVKIEPNENGSHNNQTASFCPDGYAILPDYLIPEHFPFFTIDKIEEGIITELTDGTFPPVEISPEQRREKAYETESIIEYNNEMITVDAARAICMEYAYENTDRAKQIVAELIEKITEAKETIRRREAD